MIEWQPKFGIKVTVTMSKLTWLCFNKSAATALFLLNSVFHAWRKYHVDTRVTCDSDATIRVFQPLQGCYRNQKEHYS